MRSFAAASLAGLTGLAAVAWPAEVRGQEAAVPSDFPRLVLDAGRPDVEKPERDLLRLQVQGEYQLRYQHQRSFPLPVAPRVARSLPGAVEDSLGQNKFLHHWLRLTPRLQIRDNVEVVVQGDLTGLVVGELAHDTWADETPRDERNGFSNVQLRWAYAEFKTAIGLFRAGQQPSHWGLGILANDGDHPSLFGDYRYGSISERLLFATKPAGKDSPLAVVMAADLVYRDQLARLTRGDEAFQAVLAALYERGPNQLGMYSVWRRQVHDRSSASEHSVYVDRLSIGILDVAGKLVAPVPGTPDTYVFGSAEAALVVGSTNAPRSNEEARAGERRVVQAYGGAVRLGAVHRAARRGAERADPLAFGDVVGQVEVGYASGDADPLDGTERRFVMNPNHKVGLLLFDEVLRFQSARAATAAQDPLLSNSTRPTPGIDLLPTHGGVAGAQYINPTFLVRPRRWLDLKGGAVFAQSTSDVVDPYRVVTAGAYQNARGGNPRRHDLGVEIDAGFEARVQLDVRVTLALGAQGGVLFPGGALADAGGERMKTPWIAIGRMGLLF